MTNNYTKLAFLSLIFLSVFFLLAARANAQCGDPPFSVSTWASDCRRYGGHVSSDGRRCVGWDTNWCHRGSATTTNTQTDSDNDAEVERQRRKDLELHRKEEERLAQERAAAIEKQKKEQFDRDKAEALKSMKGVSSNEVGLKGVGNVKDDSTGFFGLKGVGDTGIKRIKPEKIKPEKNVRDVSTAWNQLHCAGYITGYALSAAEKGDVDEVRYLAGEAIHALNGEQKGVECATAPPPPAIYGKSTVGHEALVSFYKDVLDKSVRDAEKINSANQRLPQLKAQQETAKQRVADLQKDSQRPTKQDASPASTQEKPKDDVSKAAAEQKAYQEQDQRKINEVYKTQQEKRNAREEALRALRTSQRALNEANSEKITGSQDVNHYRDLLSKASSDPNQIPALQKELDSGSKPRPQ